MKSLRVPFVLTFVACFAVLGGPHSLAAETAYVIDKLLVGVHKEEDLNSAIVKVLPTGTQLEVIQRKGEIAKVKDGEGITGWVDAAYLMPQPPAETQVAQLKQEKQALADRLKALEAKGTKGAPSSQLDELTNENTDLKSQLSNQKLRSSELETELNALRKTAADAGSAGGSVAAELRTANLKLTEELNQARRSLEDADAKLSAGTPLGQASSMLGASSPLALLLTTLLLGTAFAGGAYYMDYRNRRRHGGFRV